MSGNKLPELSLRTTKFSGPTDFKVNIYLHQLGENASRSSKTKPNQTNKQNREVNKTGHSPIPPEAPPALPCPAGGRRGPGQSPARAPLQGGRPLPVSRAPGTGAHSYAAPAPTWCPRLNPHLGYALGYNQNFVILFMPSVSS